MSDLPTETPDESEGMKSLRESQVRATEENVSLKERLMFSEAGITAGTPQANAFLKVYDGDMLDTEAVKASYGELFGTPSSEPSPTLADPAAQIPGEAPAPPGGAILESVGGMQAGGNVPHGTELPADPVNEGYAAYHEDLRAGRPKKDASAQVINRLVSRGANDEPGGVYNQEEYHRKLLEGAGFRPDVVSEG